MEEKLETGVIVDWKVEAERRLVFLERVFRGLPVPQSDYEQWLVGQVIALIDEEKAAIAKLTEAGAVVMGRLAN